MTPPQDVLFRQAVVATALAVWYDSRPVLVCQQWLRVGRASSLACYGVVRGRTTYEERSLAMSSMSMSVRIRLSIMMFLQYMMFAAWWVQLAQYVDNIGITGTLKALILSSMPLGCLVAPMFCMIADRHFASQKVLMILNLLLRGVVPPGGLADQSDRPVRDPAAGDAVLHADVEPDQRHRHGECPVREVPADSRLRLHRLGGGRRVQPGGLEVVQRPENRRHGDSPLLRRGHGPAGGSAQSDLAQHPPAGEGKALLGRGRTRACGP